MGVRAQPEAAASGRGAPRGAPSVKMVGVLALQLGAVIGVLATRAWGTLYAPAGVSGQPLRLSSLGTNVVAKVVSKGESDQNVSADGGSLAPFHRTRGKVESKSLRSTVEAVELEHPVTETCGLWGGTALLTRLQKSETSVCSGDSVVRVYSVPALSGDPNKENDWSAIVIDDAHVTSTGGALDLTLNCTRSENYSEVIAAATVRSRSNAEVTKMGQVIRSISTDGVRGTPGGMQCSSSSATQNRVLLVLAPENFWNWWFFLADLSSNFAALALLLPGVRPGPIHVALLARDSLEGTSGRGRVATDPMPLAEAYGYLFSSRSIQITRLYAGEEVPQGCFGSVVMLPRRGPALLQNVKHPRDGCFSPVVKAMVLHLRSAVGLVEVRPKQVTLCFVTRDPPETTQEGKWYTDRALINDNDVFDHLAKKAKENKLGFRKLEFWGKASSTPVSEQIHQAGQCSLVMGMHGAGMHVAVGMERPAMLRILKNVIANKNEPNIMTAIGGCYAEHKLKAPSTWMKSPPKAGVRGTYASPEEVWGAAVGALKACKIWDNGLRIDG